ncbi:MAG TPA: twin-arginine translocase TatA/TatE family subunit [Thermohalobaculum sp.]|nr:twin-arginine translocase TatA/TatE family subunit [Thermohalobaculum sp.]
MLNNIGPFGLIIILIVVLLLFGRGKIPQLMSDVAKGIKSFKRGMKEDLDDGEEEAAKDQEKLDKAAEEAIDVTPKKQQNKA